MRVGGREADGAVIGGEVDGGQAFRAGGGAGAFRGSKLCLRGFQVGAVFQGLLKGVFHGEGRGGGERNLIGKLEIGVRGQAGEAGEIDFLLGEVVFERGQALLLCLELHLAAVHVDLGQQPALGALGGLVVEGFGGLHLGVGGGRASFRGDGLQIGAGDGEDHEIAGIVQGKGVGAGDVSGCAVVIDRGKVDHGLRESGAEIEVIVRPDDRGEGEAGNGHFDVETQRSEVGLLGHFAERAVQVREQGGAGNPLLALRLPDHLAEVNGAQVVIQSAFDSVAQTELARKRALPGNAAREGALRLHGVVQRIDTGGDTRRGGLDGADGCVGAAASGERQLDGLRAGLCAGLLARLGEA